MTIRGALLVLLACSAAGGTHAQAQFGQTQSVAFSSLVVRRIPTLGERNQIVGTVANLPAQGVTVALNCSILHLGEAWKLSCDLAKPGTVSEDVSRAARRLAGAYRLETSQPALARDTQFVTQTSVTLSPHDLIDLHPPSSPEAYTKDIVIAERPDPLDTARYYPDRAMRMNQDGNVRMACQVLSDLSLGCVISEVIPPEFPEFAPAGLIVASMFNVEPNLRDGRSAVGSWLKISLPFRTAR
jgi:hypothetical protein